MIKFYKKLFDKYPYRVQILTAGVVTGTADVISQCLTIKKDGHFNIKRTGVMTTIGLCQIGPVYSVWYRFLKTSNITPVACVISDQALIGPSLNTSISLSYPLLSGNSVNEVMKGWKTRAVSIVKDAWKVWIPAQTVNFVLVPYHLKMIYTVFVSLLWNTYLSIRLDNENSEINNASS